MLRLTPWLSRRAPRRVAGALVGVLTVGGLLVATAAPASADNDAESVSPGNGSALTTSPDAVRIQFERPLLGTVRVSVTGPGGEVTDGRARVMGDTVVQPLDGRLPNGAYTVSWSAQSILDDSSGSTSFRMARRASRAAAKPSPTPRATPSPTPSPTPRATPSPTPRKTTAAALTDRSGTAGPSSTQAQAVVAPQVEGVGYTGGDRLPPPVVLWGLLLVLAVIAFAVKKQVAARRAAIAAAPRFVQATPPGARSHRREQREGGTGPIPAQTGPITRPLRRADLRAAERKGAPPAADADDTGPRLL